MPGLFDQDPNTPAPPGLQLATQDPSAQAASLTAQPRPGLFHRIAAGFGAPRMDPTAAEWMTPEQQNYTRSTGQAGLASSLLQASGPRPQGTANFASRMGEGFGAGMANWQDIQKNATERAMQSIQFGWQMQARNMLQKALEENPATGDDASPADKSARLMKIASRLATGGPLGAEYAKQYAELGKAVLEGSALSGEQQNKIWSDAIHPSEIQAHAWDQYQGLSGKYDRIAIAQRAQLADQIMNPDKPQQGLGAYQNEDVISKLPGIGPMLAAAFKMGKITPEDAAAMDKYVEAEAAKGSAQAEHILEHQRLIGEHGAFGSKWKGYYNPFKDTSKIGPHTLTPPRPPAAPRLPSGKPMWKLAP